MLSIPGALALDCCSLPSNVAPPVLYEDGSCCHVGSECMVLSLRNLSQQHISQANLQLGNSIMLLGKQPKTSHTQEPDCRLQTGTELTWYTAISNNKMCHLQCMKLEVLSMSHGDMTYLLMHVHGCAEGKKNACDH